MQTGHAARIRLVVAAILFSTGGAAIKATSMSAVQVASFRSIIAAFTLLLLIPAARRGWSWRAVIVGFAYAATLLLFVLANKLTTSANTIFLQSTSPLYLLLFAPLLLKEPVRRRDLWFMLAVGCGMALFFVGQPPPVRTAPNPPLGNVLAAFAGVTWALTVLGLRWLGRRDWGRGQYAAMVSGNFTVFLVCLPFALPVASVSTVDIAVIVFLGVVQIGVAYAFLARGIREVPALEASILLLVEPALNPVWSWLVHGESPGVAAVAGAVLIFGATIARTWAESRRTRLA